ncbi:hypothetical protein EUGRSUZ_G01402 [Eucalyptus grandis]|uniref:Uncharacterized protein n=2 Tax=Eucalyptus grandis TaxID=71139 RepID=A0ACC3K2M5_EUCGR|nr:hypothetical protein EUGRSUZ_G01402 [Eucalyptus grandis]
MLASANAFCLLLHFLRGIHPFVDTSRCRDTKVVHRVPLRLSYNKPGAERFQFSTVQCPSPQLLATSKIR